MNAAGSAARKLRGTWRRLQEGGRANLLAHLPGWLPRVGCSPLAANLRLTHRCSARCRTCTHWHTPPGSELSTADWKRIIGQLADAGVLSVSFTGGDIFQRADALELMREGTAAGLSVNATINGYGLTEELARDLMGVAPAAINLSLDELGDQFDRVRGVPEATASVLAAIGRLRRHANGVTRLGVAATIRRGTLRSVREVVRLALDQQLAVHFNLIHFTHYFSDTPFARDQHALRPPERQELSDLVAWVRDLRRDHPRLLPRPAHLDWVLGYFDDYRQPATPCFKPLLKVCVEPNGDVRPCCSQPPVGNLIRQTLREVAATAAFQQVVRSGLTKECPGCSCHYVLSVDANLGRRLRDWVARGRPAVATPAPHGGTRRWRSHLAVAGRVLADRARLLAGLGRVAPLGRRRRTGRRAVAFQAYAVHLAQFHEPLIRALLRDPDRYDVTLQILDHPHFPRREARDLRRFGREVLQLLDAQIKSYSQTIWEPFDLVVCADIFARLPPRAARSCLMLHGPGLTSRMFTRSLLRKSLADFDRILVNGPYDEQLARTRGPPPDLTGRVIDAGCPFLDPLTASAAGRESYAQRLGLDSRRRTILVAPSWRGLTLAAGQGATYVQDVVGALRGLDYNIVVKPHACSLNPIMARGVDWLARLQATAARDGVQLDLDVDDRPAIRGADLLITDISSRAFAFMLLGKPVLHYFPAHVPLDSLDDQRLACLRRGSLIASQLSEIPTLLQQLETTGFDRPQAAAVAGEFFSHFGTATDFVVRLVESWLASPGPPATDWRQTRRAGRP